MQARLLVLFVAALLHSSYLTAAEPVKPHDMSKMWLTSLASWQDGHVLVSYSEDQGKTFNQTVRVNPQAEAIAASGETRSKILLAKNGNIDISYTQSLGTPFAGNIRFSGSLDGGKSFSAPVTVNDNLDPITHRFETMAINDCGQIFWPSHDYYDQI